MVITLFGDRMVAPRFEALNRLWETVRESNHDFRSTTDVFPIFEVEKVSRSLELMERGTESGAANQPPKSARALDDTEQRIVAKVEAEKKVSYQTLEDRFAHFSDRLKSLDFQGQFSLIRSANASSLSDFKAEAVRGEDELHILRDDMLVAENQLVKFKQKHNLERAAKLTSPEMLAFKVSVIVFLVLVETLMNGTFLGEGSSQGLIGGIVEAVVFAVVNIGYALVLGLSCSKLLAHRSVALKLGGYLTFAVYVVVAVGINLALAHYREIAEVSFEGAGTAVLERLQKNPAGLTDLKSWLLFGLGLLFSIVAFADACMMTDPYPGFASTEKQRNVKRVRYRSRKDQLIENLTDIRNEHNTKVNDIIRELSNRRQDFQATIAHRARLISLFNEHQNQLEQAANSLLTIYREANRKSRTTAEPKYFTTTYKMERLNAVPYVHEEWNDQELAAEINKHQQELTEQVKRVGEAYSVAIDRYHQLDTIFPGDIYGQTQAKQLGE